MKFKIKRSSPLGKKLTALEKEMLAANEAARKLAKELGWNTFRTRRHVIAGGISSFHGDPKNKPAGWGYAFSRTNPRDFFPKRSLKANKELIDRIEALPVVEDDKLNKLLKYNPWKTNNLAVTETGGRRVSFIPAVNFGKEFILVGVTEHTEYKSVKDMIEITVSEYRKLGGGK